MKENHKGLVEGVSAYIVWGFLPLYWKLLSAVDSLEVLCYRIIWSFIFMLGYILVTKKWQLFIQECRLLWQDKKKLLIVITAAILITINWFTFIVTVSAGQVTQASLGYYMNPLVNVLLATLVLKEPLSRIGKIACFSAFIGVMLLIIQTGTIPFASLIMAFSFSIYGLTKKKVTLNSWTTLTIETMVILPAALVYLWVGSGNGLMQFDRSINLLLMGAGIVTAIPLLLFSEAAKRISYIVLGSIQYINPTMMLLMAVFLFHEPYTWQQFTAFAFIWLGIAIFMYGNLSGWWKEKQFLAKKKNE